MKKRKKLLLKNRIPPFHTTLWSIKKQDFYFFDNSGKYWRIFVILFNTIFRKELRNKNLLKFSPHLKSVAALPCETSNVGGESRTPLIYRTLCAGALSTVLLKYAIVTRYFLDAWQQLLLQQYFTIIVGVHFHSRLHNFIFQQDSAPAHRARDTIALLRWETPSRQTSFLPTSDPQTAQIWTPWIIRSGL